MQKPLSQIQRSTLTPFQQTFNSHAFGGFGLRGLGEREGFVRFTSEARRFCEGIDSPQEFIELWEQFLFIAGDPVVDFEAVFEMPYGETVYKVVYGPPFTVVFHNEPEGALVIFLIRRPSF